MRPAEAVSSAAAALAVEPAHIAAGRHYRRAVAAAERAEADAVLRAVMPIEAFLPL